MWLALAIGVTAALAPSAAADGPACLQAPCEGLRPGAAILVEGVPCSVGFVLRDAAGRRYLSTAGHCARSTRGARATIDGDRVWSTGRGPVVTDGAGRRVGSVRYVTEVLDESDFAVVQLDARVGVSSAPVGGGAISSIGRGVRQGEILRLAGQGLAVGEVLPSRHGVVSGASATATFTLTVAAAPGDSGGPVFDDDGRGLGVLVRGGGYVVPDPGTAEVMRLDVMLARTLAQARLRLSLLRG